LTEGTQRRADVATHSLALEFEQHILEQNRMKGRDLAALTDSLHFHLHEDSMEPQNDKRDLRIIDDSFNLPQAVAAILNIVGYRTMALPFATILFGLFLGMWGVNELRDTLTGCVPGCVAFIATVANGFKLLLILIVARSIFLTVTVVPFLLSDLMEVVRREFRKDFGL
jgi:hypothetical protein